MEYMKELDTINGSKLANYQVIFVINSLIFFDQNNSFLDEYKTESKIVLNPQSNFDHTRKFRQISEKDDRAKRRSIPSITR